MPTIDTTTAAYTLKRKYSNKGVTNINTMSEAIKSEYRKAGIAPPQHGKGVHTMRAHKAVIKYRKKGMSKSEAWKRVMGGMGKYAVKPGHRRTV